MCQKHKKKIFFLSLPIFSIILVYLIFLFTLPTVNRNKIFSLYAAEAAQSGSLIKSYNNKAVYYLGDENKRYVFPSEAIYFSWYKDFDKVITIPDSEMKNYKLAGNINLRAGTKLIKIMTDPSVYAVEPQGVLRKIKSEQNAQILYGKDWAKRIIDLPDALFVDYKISNSLEDGQLSVGSLVHNLNNDRYYYYDGTNFRHITSANAFRANNFYSEYILNINQEIGDLGKNIDNANPELLSLITPKVNNIVLPPLVDAPLLAPPSYGGGGGGGGGGTPQTLKYIVSNGEVKADIVVSSTASNMVKLAANYFQKYIKSMTGVELEINEAVNQEMPYHVYIGRSSYTDSLGINIEDCVNGGYKIIANDNYLVLIGDDGLLSILGPHSGPPENKSKAELYEEWDNLTAETWFNDYITYYDRSYNSIYNIWEADGRGTMNAVHEFLYSQGMRWYGPGDLRTITPTKDTIVFEQMNKTVNPDFPMRHFFIYYKEFTHLKESSYPNGRFEDELEWQLSLKANHFLNVLAFPYVHGLNNLLEREETKLHHPEYYAIWNGVRMNGQTNFHPDLCSDELYVNTVKYVKAMFDIYDTPVVSVMPTDGFVQISESSPECIARASLDRPLQGRLSNYVWEFVNNVAWEIYNDPNYNGKKVINSAYGAYQLPPTDLSKPFAPNLVIFIGNHRRSFANIETKAAIRDVTNQWYQALPSHQVYTYETLLSNKLDSTSQSVPSFFPHIISDDLKYLKGKSAGESMEVYSDYRPFNLNYNPMATNYLNLYITSRLYWDVDQDVDDILNEYYDLYFGPASNKMKQFIEYSELNYINVENNPSILQEMRTLLYDAKNQAGSTIYGDRIDEIIAVLDSNFLGDEVLINSCQSLKSPLSTYKLTSDVEASGTCFNIDYYGITLDCDGHTIRYGSNGGAHQHGVNADYNKNHLIIKNCHIINMSTSTATYRDAINVHRSDNIRIENNIIESAKQGMWLVDSDASLISNNTVYSSSTAIALQSVSNTSVTFNQLHSINARGLYLYDVNNSMINNNDISSIHDHALALVQSNNNTISDNTCLSIDKKALWEYQSLGNIYLSNSLTPP